MLDENSLFTFLTSQRIFVFDPETFEPVAQVTYGSDGSVEMRHFDGREEKGIWGIDGSTYWTRYEKFRDGRVNQFYLQPVDDETAQAFFSDGRRAYLQSYRRSLKETRQ